MTAQAIAEVSSVCISLRRDFCCKSLELLLWWTHPWAEPSCLESSQNGNSLGKAIFGWGCCPLCEAQPCHLSHREEHGGRTGLACSNWFLEISECSCTLPIPQCHLEFWTLKELLCVCCELHHLPCHVSQHLSFQRLRCAACPVGVPGAALLWVPRACCCGFVVTAVTVRWVIPCLAVWHCGSGEHPAVRWQLDIQGYKHEPLQTSRKQSYEITSCFLVAITQLVFKLLGWIPAGGMWHPAGAFSLCPSAAGGVSERCGSSRAVASAGYLWKWTPGTLQFPDGAAFSPLNDHNCCFIFLLWMLLLVSILYQ